MTKTIIRYAFIETLIAVGYLVFSVIVEPLHRAKAEEVKWYIVFGTLDGYYIQLPPMWASEKECNDYGLPIMEKHVVPGRRRGQTIVNYECKQSASTGLSK